MEKLKINQTDGKGFGQPENPYSAFSSLSEFHKFKKANPPHLVIDNQGEPVINQSGLIVNGPHDQVLSANHWYDISSLNKSVWDKDSITRQVYKLAEPVEKEVNALGEKEFAELDRINEAIATTPKEQVRYTIDGKPCTKKQYSDTEYASNFVETGIPEKHIYTPATNHGTVEERAEKEMIIRQCVNDIPRPSMFDDKFNLLYENSVANDKVTHLAMEKYADIKITRLKKEMKGMVKVSEVEAIIQEKINGLRISSDIFDSIEQTRFPNSFKPIVSTLNNLLTLLRNNPLNHGTKQSE